MWDEGERGCWGVRAVGCGLGGGGWSVDRGVRLFGKL